MDMTTLSKNEYENIERGHFLPEEAFQYMTEKVKIRTFREVILKYGDEKELKKLLCDALYDYNGGNRESVQKKVRGWVDGKNEPSDRETCFQICFALGLDEVQAGAFMSFCTGEDIHYRNPKELAYAFALRTNMSYRDACVLYASIPHLKNNNSEEAVYTDIIAEEFSRVHTRKEFDEFIGRNHSKLGVSRNTAYRYFMNFMKCLTNPYDDIQEDKYSIEKAVEEYIRMNLPSETKTAGHTYYQKIIKKYWPNATAIKGMHSRSEEVTRKTLILLYLITEGISPDFEENLFGEYMSEEEIFEEHFDKINIMLKECSMALLDPRNIFDWIVLYSIKTSNYEYITEEMEALLSLIFD